MRLLGLFGAVGGLGVAEAGRRKKSPALMSVGLALSGLSTYYTFDDYDPEEDFEPEDQPSEMEGEERRTSPNKTASGSAFVAKMDELVADNPKRILGGIGTAEKPGYDCSGLGYRAAYDLGVILPRLASKQAEAGTRITEEEARTTPGAFVFLLKPDGVSVQHVEYSVGDGKHVLAAQIRGGAKRYSWGWWKKNKNYADGKYFYAWLPHFTKG